MTYTEIGYVDIWLTITVNMWRVLTLTRCLHLVGMIIMPWLRMLKRLANR